MKNSIKRILVSGALCFVVGCGEGTVKKEKSYFKDNYTVQNNSTFDVSQNYFPAKVRLFVESDGKLIDFLKNPRDISYKMAKLLDKDLNFTIKKGDSLNKVALMIGEQLKVPVRIEDNKLIVTEKK